MTIAARLDRLRRSDRISATSVVGTFETFRDVRYLVAIGGKADVADIVKPTRMTQRGSATLRFES
jgi:hypothetical protein